MRQVCGFTTTEKIDIAVAMAGGIVALATLLLALATWRMARATKRVAVAAESEAKAVAAQSEKVADQAAATKEQARISVAALEASIRPWLTRAGELEDIRVVPEAGDSRNVSIKPPNVASGIALIPPDGCTVRGRGLSEGTLLEPKGHVDRPALPRGEVAQIRFDLASHDFSPEAFFGRPRNWGQFWIDVTYTDTNGQQPVRAEIHVTAANEAGTQWRVHRIAYTRLGEDASFTSVEFDPARG